MEVKYKIYNPAGNITALVIGDKYNLEQRKLINDIIMKKEANVEQVGFLSQDDIKLTMAGGEFCGNATRCAVEYYLNGNKNIEININNKKLKAGIDENEKIWCEMPIEQYKIVKLNEDIYKVILEGITIIAVKRNIAIDDENLKQVAKDIIRYYNIDDDAIGVMFIDKIDKNIKIYPIVWVKTIDTLFFENACGSGTIAVTMLETWLTKKSNQYCVEQPSGKFLETEIIIKNESIEKAILKGKIETNNKEVIVNVEI